MKFRRVPGQTPGTLEAGGLLDNTLWSAPPTTGRWVLAHGGLRQKNFNFYEERPGSPCLLNPMPVPQPRRVTA